MGRIEKYLKKPKKIIRKIYPRFGLKKNDVILATFPKSGTTWFRFVIANIISLLEFDGMIVDYHILNGSMRCSYDSFDFPKIWSQSLPRFFATHKEFNKRKFGKNRSIYLYRNPGDVMVSFFEYRKHLKGNKKYTSSFKSFIRDENLGIDAWCKNFLSWFDNSSTRITYEKIKEDACGVFRHIFENLNIKGVSNEVIKEAVKLSSFEKIKNMEIQKGKDKTAEEHLEKNFFFARKGIIGQWKSYFNKEDINYLQNTLLKYRIKQYCNYYDV